ncbi:MAG: hypothetical protein IJU66_04555 [Oscillospiraceae bacterium]|nr:hypothetical protein [Oscillospiraceae bacterium]
MRVSSDLWDDPRIAKTMGMCDRCRREVALGRPLRISPVKKALGVLRKPGR